MRSKRLFVLAASGLVLSAMAGVGCGDDTAEGTGGSGNSGGGGAGTGATGTGATGTGAMGGGGAGGTGAGDGNDSFAEAVDIAYDEQVDEDLDPIGGDSDYFKFTGQKGDLLFIDTDAKPSADEFSELYPDLVITLYDANETKIAENDDPFLVRNSNDSELRTVLPADGEYYLRVTDCIHWEGGGVDNCSPAEDIEETGYAFIVGLIDPAEDGVVLDAETGDDLASADDNLMEYVLDAPGSYFSTIAYGGFNDATDIDVYQLLIPSDITITNALRAGVFLYGPEGPDGMGTTRNAGDVWLTDSVGNILSLIDNTLGADEGARGLISPVLGSGEYFLFVEHPGDLPGGNDFYITLHANFDSGPLENPADNNDVIGTPSILPTELSESGTAHLADIEGNLAANDVDYYSVTVPAGVDDTWNLAASCAAERSGSGVRGMTVTLFDQAGVALQYADASAAMGVESASEDLYIGQQLVVDPELLVPTGMTNLVVRVEGNTPDATVLNRFYDCRFIFFPPSP